MNGFLKLLAPLGAALALAACNAGGSSNMPTTTAGASQTGASAFTHHVPEWQARHLARAACPQVVGRPTCLALIVNSKGKRPPSCTPSGGCYGFTASDLETAYNITSSLGNGSGTAVAVIEAGDEPDAASALATYRSAMGLGTANFYKYNEYGEQYNYPASCEDFGWCVETDLDIEMVSAACPKCTIYLMEAGGYISDFETAEAEAVTLGATLVSNSWICYGDWDCGDPNFPNYFDTTGVAYLASSGDGGYDEIGGPSVLDSVIAVGGTQLHHGEAGYTQSIWSDAGAGCASSTEVGGSGIAKPAWQHDPDCTYRTDADVSAQAGLQPGVAEYIGIYGEWIDVGGTSVASPFTAGVIALAGNATSENGGESFWNDSKKVHKKDFLNTTFGDDGSCSNYLCGAGKKYEKYYTGPGGWGSPNGIKAY